MVYGMDERISGAELARRGERTETVRELLYALADRVYSWSRDQEQSEDVILLAQARTFGWVPWHDRQRGK